jgi:hypothetical protein
VRYFLVFISVVALALCCSCGGDTSAPSHSNVITVTSPSIVVTPSSAKLAPGGVQQFVATVVGLSSTALLWSVQEGAAGGTIDATGKYTAPVTMGTYHVIAQSSVNLSVTASATVTITTPGEARGFYIGTFTFTGSTIYVIVPPNDKFYAVYGEGDSSSTEEWMLAGQGTSDKGSYSADLTNYWWDSGVPVSLSATYVPAVSLAGTVTVIANQHVLGSFNATAPPVSTYDYNAPASLAQVVGTWSRPSWWSGPSTANITVNATGTFTGKDGECAFSGTISPDPNKNFYDVTFTFGDAPCYFKNQTGSGVAVVTSVSDGTSNTVVFAIVVNQWYFSFVAKR